MKNIKFKKAMSLFLSMLMIFTMVPATTFSSLGAEISDYISIDGASNEVTINKDSVIASKLDIPTISIDGNTLTITPVKNADKYQLYANNNLLTTVTETTIDLSQYTTLENDDEISVIAINNQSKKLNSEKSNVVVYSIPNGTPIMKSYTEISTDDYHAYESNVYTITFLNTIDESSMNSSDTIEKWDVSAAGDSSVMTWMKLNEDATNAAGENRYDVYIAGNGGVIANPDSSYLFAHITNLKEINGLENLDTSKVTNMSSMFKNCSSLTSLNLSNFDTSNVTDMSNMFASCKNLTKLNVSSFNTSNVTDMSWMFGGCESLVSLDLSQWNKGFGVKTNMSYMFAYCSNLTSLNLSNWDTSEISTFKHMFLTKSRLNITAQNIKLTQNVRMMFSNDGITVTVDYHTISSLDLSNADTSNMTDMSYMFKDCESLKSLNLSGWDTTNVKNMEHMFYDCRNLTSLDLSSFNTSKVILMNWMFQSCSNLKTIYVGDNWSVNNVTESYYMFYQCLNLKNYNNDVPFQNQDKDFANYSNTGYLTHISEKPATTNVLGTNTSIKVKEKDYIVYTLNTTYSGAEKSNEIKVTDKLPEGLTFVEDYFDKAFVSNISDYFSTEPTYNTETNTVEFTLNNVNNATNIEVQFVCQVNNLDNSETAKFINNTAVATYNEETIYSKTTSNYVLNDTVNDMNEIQTYTVTYNYDSDVAEGNEFVRTMTYAAGNAVNLLINPSRANYEITEYTITDSKGNTITVNENGYFEMPEADVTVYIKLAEVSKELPVMKSYVLDSTDDYHAYKSNVYSITFLTEIDDDAIDACGEFAWDVSEAGDGSVMAWMILNEEETTEAGADRYDVYIAGDGGVAANPNSSNLFRYFTALEKINRLEKLDTSNVTNMGMMFGVCSSLTSLNISSFNTSEVTNMNSMFQNCSSLKTLNLSRWNTSNVTDMSNMFRQCSSLSALNINNWNTSKVTDMSYMFYNCSSLTELDLSNWNKGFGINATITSMFAYCSNLTELYLSGWDTSNVTNMESMFSNCKNLKTIYISDKWSTINVTSSTSYMFYNCINLIGQTGFSYHVLKTNKTYATTEYYMTDINFGKITEIVPNKSSVELNLGETDKIEVTIKPEDATNKNLTYTSSDETVATIDENGNIIAVGKGEATITIKSEDGPEATVKVTVKQPAPPVMKDYNTKVDNAWLYDTADYHAYKSNVVSITFLTEIDETFMNSADDDKIWDISAAGDGSVMAWMILNEEKTAEAGDNRYDVYIGGENGVAANADSSYLFYNFTVLETINGLENFDTSKVTDISDMFASCLNLESLDLSSFDTSNVTYMYAIFENCSKLNSLDISNFSTSKVTNMISMFRNCSSLTELDLSSFNTSNVKNMSQMFASCLNLESLDLSNFDTSNVTDMSSMFMRCSNLTSLDLSSFNTSNVTDMKQIFFGCSKLTELNIANWNIEKVTNKTNAFNGCTSLVELNLLNGENKLIDVTMEPELENNNIEWYSFDDAIASVSDDTITATSQNIVPIIGHDTETGYKSIIWVNVVKSKNMEINVSANKTEKLDINVDPNTITWTSTDSSVATGDGYNIIGHKVGTATLTGTLSDTGSTIKLTVNVTGVPVNGIIVDKSEVTLDIGETHEITVTLTPEDATNKNLTYTSSDETVATVDENGKITAVGEGEATITVKSEDGPEATIKVTVKQPAPPIMKKYNTKVNGDYLYNTADYHAYKSNVVSITFLTEIDNDAITECGELSWDVSEVGDGSVMAWIKLNEEETNNAGADRYDVYIAGDGGVIANANSTRLFYNFTVLETINGLENFDTSNVTRMDGMFYKCSSLTSLDLSNFNTKNTTGMTSMFENCSSLTSLNLSNFNTSNVTNMSYMFSSCSSFTSLDVSNFDTSNVTNMVNMFTMCYSLTSLDLSNFDTSKVTDMRWMFYGCSNLTSLDLSKFDTSNVINMSYMFYYCSNLTELNIANWNIEKVTNKTDAFKGCTSLVETNLLYGENKLIDTTMEPEIKNNNIEWRTFNPDIATVTNNTISTVSENIVPIIGHDTETGYKSIIWVNVVKSKNMEINVSANKTEKLDINVDPNTITWTSTDASIATGNNYDITGHKTGTTTLTGTLSDTGSKINLTVNVVESSIPVEEVVVEGNKEITLDIGKTHDIIATVKPENATNKNLTYTSSDETIATVDENGNITAVGEGTATITIKSEDGPEATVKVTVKQPAPPVMKNYTSNSTDDYHNYKSNVYSITFLTKIDDDTIDACGELAWDVSAAGDGSVMAWMIPNEKETNKAGADRYDVYIGGNNGVIANANSYWLFNNFKVLEAINGLENFDTSNVTNMSYMFDDCTNLTSLDLSNFDTSNVTNMCGMFYNCQSLFSLDLSNFNTINVTDMTNMFFQCVNLLSINISNFNTQNVINMSHMFSGCRSLTSLNLNNFDTSNVTDMSSMFSGCTNLTEINLSNFDTSKVTNMYSMFNSCSNLTDLNVSNFDTSKVINMERMFRNCTSLTSLNLSSFNTSNVTNMKWMFIGCKNLISLNLSNFNTSKVTDMQGMFYCGDYSKMNLVTLDLSGFDTSNVTNMKDIFNGCSDLTELNISNWNIEKVTNKTNAFKNCKGLIETNLLHGENKLIDTTMEPELENNNIEWYSFDDTIASVSNDTISTVSENIVPIIGHDTETGYETIVWVNIVTSKNMEMNVSANKTEKLDINVDPNTITWTSTDASIATGNGYDITGHKNGTTTLTGTLSDTGSTITLTVNVTGVPVTGIIVDKSSLNLYVKDEEKITVTFDPVDATNQKVIYTSSNNNVVTVDGNGNITAVGAGNAIITVMADDNNNIKYDIPVEVRNYELTINGPDTIYYNSYNYEYNHEDKIYTQQYTIDTSVFPSDMDNTIIWSVNNEKITIDQNGYLIFKADSSLPKDITITAKHKETGTITSFDIKLINIWIDFQHSSSLHTGETDQIKNIFAYDYYHNKPHENQEFIYEAITPEIATIDENGLIKAVGFGEASFVVTHKESGIKILFETRVRCNIDITNTSNLTDNNEIYFEATITDKIDNITPEWEWTSRNENFATIDRQTGKVTLLNYGMDTFEVYDSVTASGMPFGIINAGTIIGDSIDLSDYYFDSVISVTPLIAEFNANDNTIYTHDEGIAIFDTIINGENSRIFLIVNSYPISTETENITINVDETKSIEVKSDYSVEWSSNDESVATVDQNGNVTGVAAGKATITAQIKDTDYKVEITITVEKADAVVPEITEDIKANYGDTLADVELPEGFEWKDDTASVGNAGENTFTAIFTPEDTDNYNPVEVEITVTVEKADAEVTELPTDLKATYGDILADVELPDGFEWKDNTASVGNAGENTFTAIYTPEDTDNYNPVEVEIIITVEKADAEVTELPTDLKATYGNTLADIELPEGFEWKDPTASVGNAGENTFTAIYTPNDTDNYNPVEVEITVTVEKADAEITELPTDLKATYGDTLADVELPDGFKWKDDTSSVGNAGENTFIAIFTPKDTNNYNPVEVEIIVTVAYPAFDAVIEGPTELLVGTEDALSVILPNIIVDPTITWTSSDNAIVSVDAVGHITAIKAGTATITATIKTSDGLLDKTATLTITTYEFNVDTNDIKVVFGNTATITPTFTDGVEPENYEITYDSSDNSVVTVDGNGNIASVGAGKATITVTLKVDDTEITKTITVTVEKADAVVPTIPTDIKANYGDILADVELPEGFEWKDDTASVGNAGENKFVAIYTPEDTDNYNPIEVEITVTVEKADAVVPTIPTDIKANYGDKLADIELPEGFEWKDPTTSVGNAGENKFVAIYTPEDTDNYNPVEVEITVTVEKADAVVPTLPTDLKATYGDTLADIELPEGFTWKNDTVSVGNAGENKFIAIYTPEDTDNYNPVEVEITVTVEKADAVVPTLPTDLKATYGDTLADVELPEGFEWKDSTTSVGNAGENKFIAIYTPEDTDNYNPVEVEITVTVEKADAVVPTLPTDLKATYGDTLADVELPEGFEWKDSTTSVGNAGENKFVAIYTPEDTDNYNPVEVEITVTVEKADAVVPTLPTDLKATYGDTLADVELPEGFEWKDSTTSVGNAGENKFIAIYTPEDTDNYNPVEVEITVTVEKADAVVPTLPTDLKATYGDTLADVELPEGFEWKDSTTSVGNAGENKFVAIYTPEDTDNYNPVEVEITVTVEKADAVVPTLPTDLKATYGDTLADVELPEGFEWKDSTTSVGNAGENKFVAIYTPEDTDNYNPVEVEITVTVEKADAVVPTLPTDLKATYGDTLADVELPEGFEWKDDTTSVGNAGENKFVAIFTPEDTDNYNPVEVEITVTVEKADPVVPTIPTDIKANYGDTLADIELPEGFEWKDSTTSVGNAGENKFVAIYTPEDTDNYNPVEVEITVTVEKADAVVPTLPTDLKAIYGDTLADVELPEGFEWKDSTTSVGNAGENTFTAIYTPEDTDNYNPVEVEITVTVEKADAIVPEITEDLKATYGDTLADVDLPDGFTWKDDATSVGNAGENTFTAIYTPEDTDNYNPVEVEITVTVEKADPVVPTIPTDIKVNYGDTLADIELPEGFEWKDDATSVGNAGENTFTAIYTPEDTDNYNPVEVEITVTVEKADPVVPTIPTDIKANYGDTLADIELPEGFEWKDGTESVGNAGENTFTAIYTPEDTDNYNPVEVEITVTVEKIDAVVPTIPTDITANYGDTLADVELPEGFEWKDDTASVGNAGENKFVAIFTPEDTDNYNPVEVEITVTVEKIDAVVPTIPTDITANYGDTLADVELPEGFEWKDDTASVGNAGENKFVAIFTPEDTDNYNPVEVEITVTVEKIDAVVPTIPTDITANYGDTLADVELPEGFEWKDDTASVGNAGENTFTAIFTPEDTDNYNPVEVEITVTVEKIDAVVPTIPTDITANYGDTLADVELPEGFEWKDDTASVGNAGENKFVAIFTPEDTDNYNPVEVEITVTVEKIDAVVPTIPTDITANYGDTLADVELPEGFEWKDDTASVGNAGENTFTAIFTPEDTDNYNPVEVEITVTVEKADAEVTELPTDLKATYGDILADVELPDGFTWKDDTSSVGNAGENTFTAIFTPEDTDNYNPVEVEITVTVEKADAEVTELPTDLKATYGDILADVELPDGFTWKDDTSSVGNAGENTFTAIYTPEDTDNYNPVEVEITVTVEKADAEVPTIPTDIKANYGDTLADVELPEGFEWKDDTASVGNVGENTFIAIFTPEDTDNYNPVEVEITVTVKIPVTNIIIPDNKDNIILNKGDKDNIGATTDGTNKDVEYVVGTDGVVMVDKNGNIETIGTGTTTITIISKDNPDVTKTITVTVKIPVTNITAPENIDIKLNKEQNINAAVNSNATNKKLTYTSSNPAVVTVDSNGNIIAKSAGTAIITITSVDNPSITKEVTVNVSDYKLTVDKDEVNLADGDKYDVNINVDGVPTDNGIRYESNNTGVIEINPLTGDVKAVGAGVALVTATLLATGAVITILFNVKTVEHEIVIKNDTVTVYTGKTTNLGITVTPNYKVPAITYTSADTSIATVDANGNVKGIAVGTTTITAKLPDGKSKTVTVNVTLDPDNKISVVFSKTNGIDVFQVSTDGGKTFSIVLGNTTVEYIKGSEIIVKIPDSLNGYTYYVNGKAVTADSENSIKITVNEYTLISALVTEKPDVEEKLNWFQRLIKAIKDFFAKLFGKR